MKILRYINGFGELFDTENIEFRELSHIKPDTNNSLHLHHKITDLAFLRQFFPEKHPIFILFEESFYYAVK